MSTSPAERNRRGLKKFILLGFATLLALGFVEITLRVIHHYRRQAALANHLATDGRATIAFSDVPDLVFACRPNIAGTNSHGYFDIEHSFHKPTDVFRIVLIGDSVVVGHHVGWRASFGKKLEEELNRQSLQRRVEVILLACTGYSTSQELVLLRNEAFQYEPDLILWCYVLNDPAHPLFHRASGDLALLYEPKCHLAYLFAGAWFHLREWYLGRGGPTEFHKRLHFVYWDQVVGYLGEIGRVCREHRVPCLFMIHPVFALDETPGDYAYLDLHANLKESAALAGLDSLDLREAYRGRSRGEIGFENDPWHPNTRGHQLLADFLCRYLIANNWIPLQNSP